MNAGSNRGFRGKSVTYFEKKISDQPENIGNRKTFDEIKIPPDNVGNIIDRDPIASFIHDGLGNCLDDEPCHLKSGILTYLSGQKTRHVRRPAREKIMVDANNTDEVRVFNLDHMMKKTEKVVNTRRLARPLVDKKKWSATNSISDIKSDNFIAQVASDFEKNLEQRIGTPFSFSMKTLLDTSDIDKEELSSGLDAVKELIDGIFKITSMDAMVSYMQYCTDDHRFAVFFVNPQEKDPVKNKNFISALRHVIKTHVEKFIADEINLFLVLANAKHVIESHLVKIGAEKIEQD